MVLFQYGVALDECEAERIRAGEIGIAGKRDMLPATWRNTRRLTLKDYVAFPLLAGPFAPFVFAGNASANLIRNVWAYTIIFSAIFSATFPTALESSPSRRRRRSPAAAGISGKFSARRT